MGKQMENYYLNLLKKQINQLKSIITKVNKNEEGFSAYAYNAILSGMIIKINVIMEQTLADFHGEKSNELVSKIYNLRQLIVHYRNSTDISELEESCLDIIKEFNKVYESEKEFYKKILSYKDNSDLNVVIKNDKNIYYDEESATYIIKNDNNGLIVNKEQVIAIKSLKRGKIDAYIVKLDAPITLYKNEDSDDFSLEKVTNKVVMRSILQNYANLIEENYLGYKECIQQCLDVLYKNEKDLAALNVYIKQVSSESISMQISKFLDHYFNEQVLYEEFLKSRSFIHWPILCNGDHPLYFNFIHIRDTAKNKLLENINKKDYFFIKNSVSEFNLISSEIIKNKYLSSKQKEALMSSLLIKWVDQNLTHFSKEFIDADKETRTIYENLIKYRNYFAHDIQQFRENHINIEGFYELAKGYVSILNTLEITKIGSPEKKKEVKFVAIESEVKDFANSKYGQYLQISPKTFIGNKLFYSSRLHQDDKIIGLVPIDKDYPLKWAYYTLQGNTLVSNKFKRTKKGKERVPNCSDKKKIKFDVNCNDLLNIFVACNGLIEEIDIKDIYKPHKNKLLLFEPCEENGFTQHASSLNEIISDYYNQRYLPIELLKETHLEYYYDEYDKVNFILVDKDDKEIAKVIDSKHLKNYDLALDKNEASKIRKSIKEYRG